MRKAHLDQLTAMGAGLAARLTENADYFIGGDALFQSGAKTFKGRLSPAEGGLIWSCAGEKRPVTPEEFLRLFTAEAAKYDAATLIYRERGEEIVLEADGRGVRLRRSASPAPPAGEEDAHGYAATDREYIIKPGEAGALLRAIGVLGPDGKLKNDKIRKFNQIDRFLEQVRPLLERIDAETLTILDCACGKSYLSFALNYFVREVLRRRCFVTGVDRAEGVVRESRRIAEALGYRNMEFLVADLREYTPRRPSMVVSLHACDTATDMALGLALRSGAQAVACVPCCHRELLQQFKAPDLAPILRHGVFRARLNDVLTDGLRALKLESEGYRVSVTEYVSPIDTPKNLLLCAEKTGADNPRAREEYTALLRLLGVSPAIERYSAACGDPLQTFPDA